MYTDNQIYIIIETYDKSLPNVLLCRLTGHFKIADQRLSSKIPLVVQRRQSLP